MTEKRSGPGRPRVHNSEKTQPYTISLTPSEARHIRNLGNGNLTNGIRKAIKTMSNKIAIIKTDDDENAGVMTLFPYLEDQYCEPVDGTTVHLYLAGRDDLTAAQEMYLNTNDHVIRYDVVDAQ